jgi:Mrp family chromosome partitioning ATPase
LLPVTDTVLLSSIVDAVIVVLNSNQYDPDVLEQAKKQLENAKARVIGIIVNNMDITRAYKNYSRYYKSSYKN